MLSVKAALDGVLARVTRLPPETVALDEAVGRVLAADIAAPRPLPGFDNSAMDGYAARSAELPATLPVVATIGAGTTAWPAIGPRAGVRIFTGAPLPPELDTVVMQEDAKVADGGIALPASPPGDNVRRAGEDIALGAPVLAAGTRVVPWHTGALAALGLAQLAVARRPRVAVIGTGDELVALGRPLGRAQLHDSSAHVLGALIREAGGVPVQMGIAPDDRDAIAALLERARDCDAVVTTGGVSVGDRDHVHAALDDAGIALELYKVAMKPGKPFSFGTRGAQTVFGLPGNPVSTIVAFELFLRPALLAMQGATVVERPRVTVSLAAPYRKQPGRAHYLRARVVRDGDRLVAHAHPKQGSAMLSSLLACNAFVELAAELGDVAAGAAVPAILFEAA